MIFWIGGLLLLQLSRLFFLLKSAAYFAGLSFYDLARAVGFGFRLDASALAYLFLVSTGVEVVLAIIQVKSARIFGRLVSSLGFAIFFLASLIDAEYYTVAHKRLDASILAISADIGDQAKQLITNYSYIGFCSLLVFLLMWHLSGREKAERSTKFFVPLKNLLFFIVSVPLAIIVARGGLQEKPIKVPSAMVLADSRLITLALSTPFVLMQTIRSPDKITVYTDFPKATAHSILIKERPGAAKQAQNPLVPLQAGDNVVIFILESFGSEYSYATPFLNSLKQKGISFENHFANGKTSIEAIPAIAASLPSLLPNPYITSRFVSTALQGLPSIVSKEARDFLFFHGARKGSMYFDSFTSYLGFTRYYAKEDYTGDASALYDWGVHDHAFLDFAGSELIKEQKPFVASIFTLSSHQPFEIPKSFQTSLAEAPTPFVRSLRYADKSLQLFFEKYSEQAWFKKTLFILTGDHTSQCKTVEGCSELGSYKVPLVIVHGSKTLGPQKIYKATQHVDIAPTVAHYLKLDPSKLLPFGHSVLDPADKGVAIFRENDQFHGLFSDGVFRLAGTQFMKCENKDLQISDCDIADPVKFSDAYVYLRAVRSYFTQSLDQGSFY
jgi:phosphoglycerol transferase MdoB-like AlkP superfamily enzyme